MDQGMIQVVSTIFTYVFYQDNLKSFYVFLEIQTISLAYLTTLFST